MYSILPHTVSKLQHLVSEECDTHACNRSLLRIMREECIHSHGS
jgi:hypothetical protein